MKIFFKNKKKLFSISTKEWERERSWKLVIVEKKKRNRAKNSSEKKTRSSKSERVRERKGKKIQDDNGWVIYDQLQPNAHANLKLFRKIALCCHVNFTFNPNLSCKGGGISEKLLKYWTCVKFPNLDCYFMLFSLSFARLVYVVVVVAVGIIELIVVCLYLCVFFRGLFFSSYRIASSMCRFVSAKTSAAAFIDFYY